MSTSSWTSEDLIALERAIAKGVKSVKYTDKEVVYRTLEEMLQTRDKIKACINPRSFSNSRCYASTSKGLC